jgi:hypothetical protein
MDKSKQSKPKICSGQLPTTTLSLACSPFIVFSTPRRRPSLVAPHASPLLAQLFRKGAASNCARLAVRRQARAELAGLTDVPPPPLTVRCGQWFLQAYQIYGEQFRFF